jgi:hypothetical protein
VEAQNPSGEDRGQFAELVAGSEHGEFLGRRHRAPGVVSRSDLRLVTGGYLEWKRTVYS